VRVLSRRTNATTPDVCVPHLRSEAFYIPAHEIIYSLVLRRLISAYNRLSTRCYDQQWEIEQLLDEAEKEIFAITGEHVTTEIVPTKELVMEAIEQIEKLYESRGAPFA